MKAKQRPDTWLLGMALKGPNFLALAVEVDLLEHPRPRYLAIGNGLGPLEGPNFSGSRSSGAPRPRDLAAGNGLDPIRGPNFFVLEVDLLEHPRPRWVGGGLWGGTS